MAIPIKTGCAKCPGIKEWVAEMSAQPGFMNTRRFWEQYNGKRAMPYINGESFAGKGVVATVPGPNGYLLRVPGEFCKEHPDNMQYMCYRGNVEIREG